MKLISVALALAALTSLTFPALAEDWRVRRVTVAPLKTDAKDCWEKAKHGDISITYRDRRKTKVTSSGMNANDAKIAPDGRTVGWTRGTHQPCTDWSVGGTMFVNSELVLFRNGKPLRTFSTPGTFIENWRFWNQGKYVAIGSRWHHGLGYCRLFEVKTGKLLERISTPAAENQGRKWAIGLTS